MAKAVREEKQLLLGGGGPKQEAPKLVQMLLVDAVPLSIIDREGVPVEIIRELPEQSIGEIFALQHAKEA